MSTKPVKALLIQQDPMLGVWSDADIARAHGASRERVRQVRNELGIPAPPKTASSKYPAADWKRAYRLWRRRVPCAAIAEQVGIPKQTLRERFRGLARNKYVLDRYRWAYGRLPQRILAACARVRIVTVSRYAVRHKLPKMPRNRALNWSYRFCRRQG